MDDRPLNHIKSPSELFAKVMLFRASALPAAVIVVAMLTQIAPAEGAPTRAHGRAGGSPAAAAASSSGGTSAPGSTPEAKSSPSSGSKPRAKPKSSSAPAGKPKAKARSKRALKGNPARALLTFKAMQQAFYIPGSGLYKGEPYSYLWPFSQALAATVSVERIPGESAKLKHEAHVRLYGLERYWGIPAVSASQASGPGETPAASPGEEASPLPSYNGSVILSDGTGNTSYYDDNEWVGIELARLYELYHEASALKGAQEIMSFVMAGWQSDSSLACPGGVPFSSASNQERNTVTTAPASELGVQLYRLTHNLEYLQFAEMAYEWVRTCLLTPSGLYADHIGIHGRVTPNTWSYNQGTMIGAGALLYQVTDNSAYLYQARQTATAALGSFTPTLLGSENPFFVSVYFRNLLYLDSITHDPPGPKIAQAFVNYAWQHLRLSNNTFVFGSPASSQLLYQAAIVQIYALLSEPASAYF